MKFLKYTLIIIFTLFLIASAGYLLAASGIESKPGYAKLSTPSWFFTDNKIALNLGPIGLKPARWVAKRIIHATDEDLQSAELELLSLLDDIHGLQLRIYNVKDDRSVFEQAIDESVSELKKANWQTLIKVREDDKHIVVMKPGNDDGDIISGLSVLLSTPDNAVFINLVGQLNLEKIALVAAKLQ